MINKKELCLEILKRINNQTTKVKQVDNIKGNYYAYLTDTIYLSERDEGKKSEEEQLVVLCHESIHSIQSKKKHILNLVLSNIELIISIILILLLLNRSIYVFITSIFYFLILISSIIFRLMLEKNAVRESFKLAKNIAETSNHYEIQDLENKSRKFRIIFYISLFWKKIIKALFVIFIYYAIK